MKVSRRGFLGTTAAGAIAAGGEAEAQKTPVPASELDELTIAQFVQKYTAQSLVEKYLARIHDVDRAGPTLQAR